MNVKGLEYSSSRHITQLADGLDKIIDYNILNSELILNDEERYPDINFIDLLF